MSERQHDDEHVLGVAEAKRRFSELIDRVQQGEQFVIERRGKPAVTLVRPEEAPPPRKQAPNGFLSLLGLFDGWMTNEEVDEMVKDIYAARRRARDRPAPDLG